ncbi:MAG: hypothetical protein IJ345_00685 [Clostridia bacterium]|nr:hypothetical protein [Clostridia bacterium]
MKDPKVLVVGINPWIDNTGINTLINFFDGWDKDSLAHLYTRSGMPNTKICDRFFRISEPKVLKSILKRGIKTGESVPNSDNAGQSADENKIYKKKRGSFTALCREAVWLLGKWKTKELDSFLTEYDADVLFFPVYSNVYMCRLQNYIAKKTNKPVILYSSDDNYSYKCIAKDPFSLLHRFWLRQQEKKLFKRADKVMVITPKQKEEYDRIFGVDSVVLTKGVDFSNCPFVQRPVADPVRIVYTGKLIIGRWKTLAAIADVLGEINKERCRFALDIYTTDEPTGEQRAALNRNGSQIKGALTLSEVQNVQAQADILVFVESLEKKYKNAARLSFSTKITDYLKSGKCILAIGDKDIAPIDYFVRYDSAVTATSYLEIKEKLKMLADDTSIISEYSQKAYACGKDHHDKAEIDRILRTVIMTVVRKNR